MNYLLLVGTLMSVKEFEGSDAIITVELCNSYYYKTNVEVVVKNILDNEVLKSIKIGDTIGIKGEFREINEEVKVVAKSVSYLSGKVDE